VVTGTVNWSQAPGRVVSGVTHVIVHPLFDNVTGRDDAALLVLGSPTPAPPLRLQAPADTSASAPDSVALFAGWGQTSGTDSMSVANALGSARTVIQARGYCQNNIAPFDASTQLCAHDAPYYDTSACFGDSGGPLIANVAPGQSGVPVQAGIVRGSPGQCDPRGDVVFTAVQAISSWANAVITSETDDPSTAVTPPPLPFAAALSRLYVTPAKSYVHQILASRFGVRFRHGGGYATRCSQRRAYRVRCAVRWSAGSEDYWGSVSVFYVVSRGSAVWSNHYAIKWVSDRCSPRSTQPRRCRISRARGTY
jgi:hypothetical protein